MLNTVPPKNRIKTYVEGGIYHVYNRGVEGRKIFEHDQDYLVFLQYLKQALTPLPKKGLLKVPFTLQGSTFQGVPRQPKNFVNDVELLGFCLMQDHFHFLLKQKHKTGMAKFMQSIGTRYSMYFNKKYERTGRLFQGIYKAVLVTEDSHLLHLSRYIHLNPREYTINLEKAYSSYPVYLKKVSIDWVKPKMIVDIFKNTKDPLVNTESYKDFVENPNNDTEKHLGKLTIE